MDHFNNSKPRPIFGVFDVQNFYLFSWEPSKFCFFFFSWSFILFRLLFYIFFDFENDLTCIDGSVLLFFGVKYQNRLLTAAVNCFLTVRFNDEGSLQIIGSLEVNWRHPLIFLLLLTKSIKFSLLFGKQSEPFIFIVLFLVILNDCFFEVKISYFSLMLNNLYYIAIPLLIKFLDFNEVQLIIFKICTLVIKLHGYLVKLK